MATKLLIVESPAKAKTINKYLGSDYKVLASFGHVRDLPKKNGSIDVNNDFAATYQIIARNKKHVDEILLSAKSCDQILLATDPDREGEAIAWHLLEILKMKKDLANKIIKRVTFNEITQSAIKAAIASPRDLDFDLVDAQQARLTLDYLMGFNISPLLWRKIKPGLSAGRVQSPALRLICERENEIKSFIPEDYFSLHLHTHKNSNKFYAKLIEFAKKKIDTKTIKLKDEAIAIKKELEKYKLSKVINIAKKQKKKNPLPPFITSSLQIEGARKLGFNTDRTMKLAQSLYEGIELGQDTVGLISYMRTDSVGLSSSAVEDIRAFIKQTYTKEYLPNTQVNYINKVKNAQEAHEAIRPTSIFRTPESIKKYLTNEQYKLYELIWLRSVACQMSSALLDTTAVDIQLDKAVFRANGITINFDGFMKVYQEELEETDSASSRDEIRLPELSVGEELPVDKLEIQDHQTEPKPRYSEASLVKSLEELGIGRPSTYASIISTLKKREYVIMDKKRFISTDIGSIVNQFLTNHLTKYVDFQFTANLENTLDDISNGEVKKLPILKQFWTDLETIINEKQGIARSELVSEKLDENCPQCGKHLLMRLGKYGKFIGCSGYPECKYMRKVAKDSSTLTPEEPEIIEGRQCPKDSGTLVMRTGKFGKFISCKNYPKCKYIENIDKPVDDDAEKVHCPNCKDGLIIAKKNRYGSWFYACNNYPECKTLFNHKPLAEKCPECDYKILLHKITKTKGEQKCCPNCDFKISI